MNVHNLKQTIVRDLGAIHGHRIAGSACRAAPVHQESGICNTRNPALALGIAANSTIFSWINSTLLNPIPGIAHTRNMITIMRGERSEHPTPPFSSLDFADLRDSSQSFSGLLPYHDDYMAITGSGKPQRIYGTLASSNYFEVLGIRPILGRSLLPSATSERLGVSEAVLGYDLWQKQFAANPSIVGKVVLSQHWQSASAAKSRNARSA